MVTLAISYLSTSNLPWFIDLTFQVPMQYSSYSIGPCFHHQSYPQLGIVFALTLSLHSFWSSFSSSILDTYQAGEFIFQYPIFLPFHTVHGILKTRILKWFGIPFSSGPHFVQTLHHDPLSRVALCGMAHSFIELDKAVVHVISLVSFLWFWFSVCLPYDLAG